MLFSERLKFLREKNNYTKLGLAEELGMSRMSYFRYEKGERLPNYEVLLQMADFFNVSVDYLMCRTDCPKVTH
jgi:transcriptional regulator with XRE-family HTH domain